MKQGHECTVLHMPPFSFDKNKYKENISLKDEIKLLKRK